MKIIIDTNVLISAFVFKGFSATVFDYCATQEQIYLSEWVLNELSEKMKEKFNISSVKVNNVVELIKEKAIVEIPDVPTPDVCRDKDDKFTSVGGCCTG